MSWEFYNKEDIKIIPITNKRIEDLTNKRFGKLTVLGFAGAANRKTYWWCECDCGNIKKIRRDSLIAKGNRATVTCGRCRTREHLQNDLTNKKFGKLTAIKKIDSDNNGNVMWECLCDCGRTTIKRGNLLTNGQIQSCGKCRASRGEEAIKNILENNNIEFEKEKKFDNCCFADTNSNAKFDFYLPKENILIEYDGEQHFFYNDSYWNTEEKFKKTQEHDEFKNNWCKKNNIPLIRIPYTHLKELSIEDLKLETSKFLI